jgi:hypothetical protein
MDAGSEDAREAALRRIADLEQQAERAVEAFQAAQESDDLDQRAEASGTLLSVEQALLRAYADAGQWSDIEGLAMTPAEAATTLLERRQTAAAMVPRALEIQIAFAVATSDDPQMQEVRERARAALIELGWVTASELETFPEASLKAIVLERFQRWADEH